MPIKDLTEVVRVPRLGKFHLGYKDPQRGFPVKTDYFVLAKETPGYAEIIKVIGEKPKELNILIPLEDEDVWASQYYKTFTLTHGLVCKGDGETAGRVIDIKTKNFPDKQTATVNQVEIECKGRDCPEYLSKKCRMVMNLRFMLPDLPGIGVWQIDTSSVNSILNVNSCAKVIKKAFGRISMIPLKLTLEGIDVNNPQDGKKQKVYVLNLRTSVTLAQLAEATRNQSKMFLLEPPDLESAYGEELAQGIEDLYGEGKDLKAQKKEPEKSSTEPPAKPPETAVEGQVKASTSQQVSNVVWGLDVAVLEANIKKAKMLTAWQSWIDSKKWLPAKIDPKSSVGDVLPKLTKEQAVEFDQYVTLRVK